jgi:hypothetical protein
MVALPSSLNAKLPNPKKNTVSHGFFFLSFFFSLSFFARAIRQVCIAQTKQC